MNRGLAIPKALALMAAVGYHVVQKGWEKLFAWGIKKAQDAPIPVISIGNLVMGGSGKTPFAICLATMLRDLGMKPAVISRGYRGTSRAPYLVVSDGTPGGPLAGADVAGDEPFLMARCLGNVPVLIGRKRIIPVQAAFDLFGCNVAVLDDGFQHHQLKRDLDIVLLSGREDRMFPSGHLREPLSALKRAHAVIIPAEDQEPNRELLPYLRDIPVFRCRTVPLSVETCGDVMQTDAVSVFSRRDVVLVSGIANPARFRRTAEALEWNIVDHCCFPDHHWFADEELERLLATFPGIPLVFTEKDRVKLPPWFTAHESVAVLHIGVALDDEEGFRHLLRARIRLQP